MAQQTLLARRTVLGQVFRTKKFALGDSVLDRKRGPHLTSHQRIYNSKVLTFLDVPIIVFGIFQTVGDQFFAKRRVLLEKNNVGS